MEPAKHNTIDGLWLMVQQVKSSIGMDPKQRGAMRVLGLRRPGDTSRRPYELLELGSMRRVQHAIAVSIALPPAELRSLPTPEGPSLKEVDDMKVDEYRVGSYDGYLYTFGPQIEVGEGRILPEQFFRIEPHQEPGALDHFITVQWSCALSWAEFESRIGAILDLLRGHGEAELADGSAIGSYPSGPVALQELRTAIRRERPTFVRIDSRDHSLLWAQLAPAQHAGRVWAEVSVMLAARDVEYLDLLIERTATNAVRQHRHELLDALGYALPLLRRERVSTRLGRRLR